MKNLQIVGDLMCHQSMLDLIASGKQIDCLDNVKLDAKYRLGNFETTISDDDEFTTYPKFKSPVQFAEYIASKFNILSVANNHINDYGANGFNKTIDVLKNLGVAVIGTADNTHVVLDDINTVIYACVDSRFKSLDNADYVNKLNYPDIAKLAKLHNDKKFIVYVHAGYEYDIEAKASHVQMIQSIMQLNNNISVIANHSHVLQDVSSTKFNNYAVESLGNFVASQHESKSALTKLATMLEFDDNFDITIQMFFNTNDKLYNLHNFKSSTLQESLKYHKCLKYAHAFYVKHDYSLQQ